MKRLWMVCVVLAGCLSPLPDGASSPADDRQQVWAGDLLQVHRTGTHVTLSLQTTVRDCERHAGLHDLQAWVPPHLMPLATASVEEFRHRTSQQSHQVPLEDLSEGGRYLMRWRERAADGSQAEVGDVVDVVEIHGNRTVEARLPAHGDEPHLWIAAAPGAEPRVFVDARRPASVDDLRPGPVLLRLGGDPVRLDAVQDAGGLAEACHPMHAHDLVVLVDDAPRALPAGSLALDVRVKNVQDHPLVLSGDRALLVDLDILRPYMPVCPEGRDVVEQPGLPGGAGSTAPCAPDRPEDWLDGAAVPGCTVAVADVEVPAQATAPWPMAITCDEPVAQRDAGRMAVWASGSFTDELGGQHPIPYLGMGFVATFVDAQSAS